MRDTSKIVALQVGRTAPMFSKAQLQVYSPAGEGMLNFSVAISHESRIPLYSNSSYSGTKGN